MINGLFKEKSPLSMGKMMIGKACSRLSLAHPTFLG